MAYSCCVGSTYVSYLAEVPVVRGASFGSIQYTILGSLAILKITLLLIVLYSFEDGFSAFVSKSHTFSIIVRPGDGQCHGNSYKNHEGQEISLLLRLYGMMDCPTRASGGMLKIQNDGLHSVTP